MLDLRSRRISAVITWADGSNPLDISSLVESFVVGDSSLDQSGLIKTTGTLVLKAKSLADIGESLSPRTNRKRWAKGNRLIIDIPNAAGTLIRHPRGRLRILKKPRVPTRSNPKLEIQVGCALSLLDYRSPPDDASGIPLGSPTNRDTIINSLASRAGCPALIDAVPGWPIDYPIFQLGGGWVEQMGHLAFAAGHILWIDNQERLRAKKIPLKAATADFTLFPGADYAYYDVLEADETPPDKIVCTAIAKSITPVTDPQTEWYVNRNPTEAGRVDFNGFGTSDRTVSKRVKQEKGEVFPEQYPGSTSLITRTRTVDTDSFDAASKLLKSRTSLLYEPIGCTQPNAYPGNTDLDLARKTVVGYTYEDEVTIRERTLIYEQQGVVNPANANLLTRRSLTLSRIEVRRWRESNGGWLLLSESINRKRGAPSSGGVSFSGNGNNQPPAPERMEEPSSEEETTLTAERRFPTQPGANYEERSRDFEVPTAISEEQLSYCAEVIGTILHGRDAGIEFESAVSDDWLTDYEPLRIVDAVDEDGVKSRYIADAVAFNLESAKFNVAAAGINLGVVQGSAVEPPFDLTEDFSLALELELEFFDLEGSADAGSEDMNIALEIGVQFDEYEGEAIAIGEASTTVDLGFIITDAAEGTGDTDAIVTVGAGFLGTWTADIQNAEQVWVYYSASAPAENLAGLRIAQYYQGVDYDNSTPLTLTALFANGPGYYVVGPYNPSSDSLGFWADNTSAVISSDPAGGVTVADGFHTDSANLDPFSAAFVPVFHVLNVDADIETSTTCNFS